MGASTVWPKILIFYLPPRTSDAALDLVPLCGVICQVYQVYQAQAEMIKKKKNVLAQGIA